MEPLLVNSWTADIESLQTRQSLLHGWGSLHGSGQPPYRGWLEFRFQKEGDVGRIPAIFGETSQSADELYTNINFVLYGVLEQQSVPQEMFELVLEWPNKRLIRLKTPPPRYAPPGRGMARILALPWKHYFKRGMRLIRQGQSRLLFGKVIRMILAFFSSGWDPARLLQWAEAEGKPLALVIDHDLGGGANLYRQSLMKHLASERFAPILLSVHHGVLMYQLVVKRGRRTRTAHIEDLNVLFQALSGRSIGRVIFNNIISYPAPLDFVDTLTKWLKHEGSPQFLFLMHDHYCICPSWQLLDSTGRYCGIPNVDVCAKCLPANTIPFLEFARGVDIVSWRSTWVALLQEANEIRCFSNATRNLLLRAHTEISPGKVSVVPHNLDHVLLRKITLKDPGWPVIGIVGQISYSKGCDIVRDLANHIILTRKKARVIVVGTIELDLPKDAVTITGHYHPEQLPELLEAHGVNVGFLPSIWPETFSYVTEEMITMGLPILVFDMGAPAERVTQYPLGRVIPTGNSESILKAIEELYNEHVRTPQVRQS